MNYDTKFKQELINGLKQKKFDDKLKEQESKNEKTETQKKNWITFEDVTSVLNTHKEKVLKFTKLKEINRNQYNQLLNLIVLGII